MIRYQNIRYHISSCLKTIRKKSILMYYAVSSYIKPNALKNYKIALFKKRLDTLSQLVFPANYKNFEAIIPENFHFKYKRVAIFASFSTDGCIADYVVYYLKELKKEVDAIIFITDNPLRETEIHKLNDIVYYYKCMQHGEYDFGSYKRGFQYFMHDATLQNTDELVFCNDSCVGPFKPFNIFFNAMQGYDFYGMTINQYGFKFTRLDIIIEKSPHIQSYFFVISKKIFQQDFFIQFMNSIKKEKYKRYLIYLYELGLSKCILSHGITPHAYYQAKGLSDPMRTEWKNIRKTAFLIKKGLHSENN